MQDYVTLCLDFANTRLSRTDMCQLAEKAESPRLLQGWGGEGWGVLLSSWWTERTSVTTEHKEKALEGVGVPSCNHRGVPNTRTLINQRLLFNLPPCYPEMKQTPFHSVSRVLWLKWEKWVENRYRDRRQVGTRVKYGGRKGRLVDGKKKKWNEQWKERMTQLSILPFINFHPMLPSSPLFR